MVAAANMVEVAALVGDTARATMLAALMGGQALTASELAALARVSKSTASGHLSKLVKARLLDVTQKRRNRYYRIASPLVARMLEGIRRSQRSRRRRVISRVRRRTTRCALPAPVTTTSPARSASPSPMRWWPNAL